MSQKEPGQSIYLSIVVPLYNEEESFDNLVAGILTAAQGFAFTYEIILVDDGSTDNTWQCIERQKERVSHLRGIKFRRNFGQTAAMVAGFDHALGEIIVTMDGDLQNDPADIPMLVDKMKEGFDIVSGWRKDRKDHEWVSEEEVGEWAGYLKEHMGWPHLLMARGRTHPNLDVRSISHYGGPENLPKSYDDVVKDMEFDESRPHIYEERFLHGRWDYFTMDVTRRHMWWYAMVGGMGGFWGVMWDDGPQYPNFEQMRTHK